MATPELPVMLTRFRHRIGRPAIWLALLLALAGQIHAAAHDHTHADSHVEAAECLVCHTASGMDGVGAASSRCSISPCLAHALVPTEPSWTGFDPRQTANARAPPAC